MTYTDFLILQALGAISYKYNKLYCYPSQEKILDLLKKNGLKISRRTLNYRLKHLEDMGFFVRQRRIKRDPKTNKFHFQSTLYFLKEKFIKWSLGAVKIFNKIKHLFRVQRFAHHCPFGGKILNNSILKNYKNELGRIRLKNPEVFNSLLSLFERTQS